MNATKQSQLILTRKLCVWLLVVAMPTLHATAGTIVGFGGSSLFGQWQVFAESEDFGQVFSQIVNDPIPNLPDARLDRRARATRYSLGAAADGYFLSGSSVAQLTSQVVFGLSDGAQPVTHANVSLIVDLHGQLIAEGATSVVSVELAIIDGGLIGYEAFSQNATGFQTREIDQVVSVSAQVPIGQPITFRATLRAIVLPTGLNGSSSQFFSTMEFDPQSFFNIQTPGVTVNSFGSDWLLNNQIVPIREPTTLMLAAAGALGVVAIRRRQA
jgi:hypothetical protein